ncbi:hypothetical protein SFUL_4107 [Streptomyces microflavus DSM 40593]|uniref:Uncharacterized protein n=1 Tax=Streptomyces microflavus DSM 40593 TaxID=1303692 RepID=N0CZM4_STRMI|nr:hypothetical protein SFUL_4107 [Streptomyces microflavus DSM 40593]
MGDRPVKTPGHGGGGRGSDVKACHQGIDVAPAVDVDDEEAVGASVVGGPPGALVLVNDPGAPGDVLLGVGGSVSVPAGGGGAGDG